MDRDGKLKNCYWRIQDYMEDRSASPLRLEESRPPLRSHCRSLVQSICTSAASMERQKKEQNETRLYATGYLHCALILFLSVYSAVWFGLCCFIAWCTVFFFFYYYYSLFHFSWWWNFLHLFFFFNSHVKMSRKYLNRLFVIRRISQVITAFNNTCPLESQGVWV